MDNPRPHVQTTLANSINFSGIGLHTGREVSVAIFPAYCNHGIKFFRTDTHPGCGLIEASWHNVIQSEMSTAIGNKHQVTIQTVEHLLAALYACNIDNALIEISGPEVPIMDGSAQPFIALLDRAGVQHQSAYRTGIRILRSIQVNMGDKYAIMLPSKHTRFTVAIEFSNTRLCSQVLSLKLTKTSFQKELASARTFGFEKDLSLLRGLGLIKGATLQNAVLADVNRVINKEGLRYRDEFVRHKILDCIGDLSLLGSLFLGHYIAYKPGHALNIRFVQQLFAQRAAWTYATLDEHFGVRTAAI